MAKRVVNAMAYKIAICDDSGADRAYVTCFVEHWA